MAIVSKEFLLHEGIGDQVLIDDEGSRLLIAEYAVLDVQDLPVPRGLMFVEQVKYTEPYSLQLIGGDDQRLETFLAQKGIRSEADLSDSLKTIYFPKDKPIITPYPPEIKPPPGGNGGGPPGGWPPGGVLYPCGQIPLGGIIMWSGAIADIPECWALCDGSPPTPDLRNRFIVSYGDKYNVGDTGGSDTVDISHLHAAGTLVADDESAHTHGIGTYVAANESAHTHGIGTYVAANESLHTHGDGNYAAANDTHNHSDTFSIDNDTHDHNDTFSIDNDTHDHAVNAGTTANDAHDHGPGTYGTNDADTAYAIDGGVTVFGTLQSHTHDITTGTSASDSHNHGPGTLDTDNDQHNHGISGSVSNDTHNHNISGSVSNDTHNHDVTGTSGVGSAHTHTLSGTSGTGSAHTHSLSGTSGTGSAHGHTISGDTATGGSVALNVVPYYYALAFIMRTS